MNLTKKRTDIVFFISLALTLFAPQWHLLYFVPFIIILIYKNPLVQTLWGALGCGVILDLLSSDTRIGTYAFTYAATAWAIYPLKRNFFADTISTLPIMTFFFSTLSTLVTLVLRFSFKHPIVIQSHWVLSDLLIYPLLDAIYAFCLFVLPQVIIGKRQMRGEEYFSEE